MENEYRLIPEQNPSSNMPGWQFVMHLGDTLRGQAVEDPDSFADKLVDVFVSTPLTDAEWIKRGVKPGHAQNVTVETRLLCLDMTTSSQERTQMFTEGFDRTVGTTGVDPLANSDLLKVIPHRLLLNQMSDIDAVSTLLRWMIQRYETPREHLNIFNGFTATLNQDTDRLKIISASLKEHDLSDLALVVDETVQERIEAEEKKAQIEAERKKIENKKRNRKNVLDEKRYPLYRNMVMHPGQRLDNLMKRFGISDEEGIERAKSNQIEKLVVPASWILRKVDSGYEYDEGHLQIAERIAQVALAKHSIGKLSVNPSLIEELQIRPLYNAETIADFWRQMHILSEYRSEILNQDSSALFVNWKEHKIKRQTRKNAVKTLIEHGIQVPDSLPKGLSEIEIKARANSIVYGSADELIDNLRTYFIPRSQNFIPAIANTDQIALSAGDVFVEFADFMNKGGNVDRENMQRLEREIRLWMETDMNEPYVDSYDYGSGDPYKYTGGMFSGHRIGIEKRQERYHLLLRGGGYSMNMPYAEMCATVMGKELEYQEGLTMEFTPTMPDNIDLSDRHQIEDREYARVNIDMGVDAIGDQLEILVGKLSKEERLKLKQLVTHSSYRMREEELVLVERNGIQVKVMPTSGTWSLQLSDDGGRVDAVVNIRIDSEGRISYPPHYAQVNIKINSSGNPEEFSTLASIAFALQTTQNKP